ncbi:MAG: hypothetical protein CMG74_04695 [Candidatus Marinimicrobia bacterium]|nr:hypothetical protein [Candidatus Neomarinimicrobiota bacterium]|tara:strand:- start:2258 stop:3139 length:882 start_codon:yes stop_codon:yes gene_type:complete
MHINNYFFSVIYKFKILHFFKNLLIFYPWLIYQDYLSNKIQILNDFIIPFILLCITSYIVYLINDYYDIVDDTEIGNNNLINNLKLSKNKLILIIIFYILVLFYFSKFNFDIFILLIIYLFINIIYNLILKKIILIDILAISCLYLIRLIIGFVIINNTYFYNDHLFTGSLVNVFFSAIFVLNCKRIFYKIKILNYKIPYSRNIYNYNFLNSLLKINFVLSIISFLFYLNFKFDLKNIILVIIFSLLVYDLLNNVLKIAKSKKIVQKDFILSFLNIKNFLLVLFFVCLSFNYL